MTKHAAGARVTEKMKANQREHGRNPIEKRNWGMTVQELIKELHKHPLDLPVVIATEHIYDENIKVIFNSEVGVEIRSAALDSITGDEIGPFVYPK